MSIVLHRHGLQRSFSRAASTCISRSGRGYGITILATDSLLRSVRSVNSCRDNNYTYNNNMKNLYPPTNHHSNIRWFTPMTKEEEENEKIRVQSLTPFQKDQELRKLNRQIAKLEMLKGIHTGELYTWSGRYKQLARDYGMPMFVYYWVVWSSTAVVCYAGITVFSIDCMALLSQVDGFTGWDLSSKVDPEMGKIGMAILLNELLEPVRLPVVILTVKPVIDNLFPPKY